MSFLNSTAPASLLARISGFFADLGHRHAQYRVYRETFEQLNSLSDRDLADLGIARPTIRAIAYQAAFEG